MAPTGQTNQSKLIFFLVIVLGIAAGYIYYSFIAKGGEAAPALTQSTQGKTLEAFRDMKIDWTILDNSVFKTLQVFGESPVSTQAPGKKDLFAPF